MKKSIVLAVCFGASTLALGQGLIHLRNKVSALGINARVVDGDGNPLSGADGWVAQAYVSDAENGPYTPVAGAVTPFYSDKNSKYGYLVPLVAAVPGIPENTAIWVRLYVWNAVHGATYEEADAAGGRVGASNSVHVTLGGPEAPADLVGLEGWSLPVPPPPFPSQEWWFTRGVGGLIITYYSGSDPEVSTPTYWDVDPVVGIGDHAFSYSHVTRVAIGSGVTSIAASAFAGCSDLVEVQVSGANPNYCSLDGVLFDKARTRILVCPAARSGDYSIPDGVIDIGDYAFYGCRLLNRVEIPATVTSIGAYSFYNCSHLVSALIPFGVTRIGNSAYRRCASLTDVTIPASVTSIGDYAFQACTSLAAMYFEGDKPDIPGGVFSGANAVVPYFRPGSLHWPDGVYVAGESPLGTALWIPLILGDPSEPLAAPLRLRSGTPAPAGFRVQRSTNLRDWEDWQAVSRTDGPRELDDPGAGVSPYRFYRAVESDGN